MTSLSTYITDLLVEYKFVEVEKREICIYGLENLIISFLEIISVLILAVFLRIFFYTIIFISILIILRRYTGGYHAKTKKSCYGVLIIIYLGFSALVKYFPVEYICFLGTGVLVFSNYMTFRYAPIIDPHKNVDSTERRVYRKFSIVLTAILSLIVILGFIFVPYSKILLALIASILAVSASMLAALKKGGGVLNE